MRAEIPRFNYPIIETHCHLDYLKAKPIEEILGDATAVGIERFVTIAVSPSNLDAAIACTQLPGVWATQGIHPHEANDFTDGIAAKIRENAAHPRVVAIGEIGLDYFYDHSDRNRQLAAFEQQLAMAAELDLPVVIHTRDADEDTRAVLQNAAPALKRKGVIHSFTSGIALAEFCIGEGFVLGFNGIATFNKADNVRDVIRITPLEHIVLETDAPFLTPIPYRGKENAPCYLPFIAAKIAEVKSVAVETVLEKAYQNSIRLFFS
jgi:TatD DNase family protein